MSQGDATPVLISESVEGCGSGRSRELRPKPRDLEEIVPIIEAGAVLTRRERALYRASTGLVTRIC